MDTTENLLIRCQCGGPHYLDVLIVVPEWELWVFTLVDHPRTLWERLRLIFSREDYAREILLETSEIERLVQALQNALDKLKSP